MIRISDNLEGAQLDIFHDFENKRYRLVPVHKGTKAQKDSTAIEINGPNRWSMPSLEQIIRFAQSHFDWIGRAFSHELSVEVTLLNFQSLVKF
ncbi:MAG: hypothetical protein ACE5HI_10300 [bacterium]